jgi:hypothetical protein
MTKTVVLVKKVTTITEYLLIDDVKEDNYEAKDLLNSYYPSRVGEQSSIVLSVVDTRNAVPFKMHPHAIVDQMFGDYKFSSRLKS